LEQGPIKGGATAEGRPRPSVFHPDLPRILEVASPFLGGAVYSWSSVKKRGDQSLPNFIFVLRKIELNQNLEQKVMNQHPTKNGLNKPKSAEILVGNSMLHSMSPKTLPILPTLIR